MKALTLLPPFGHLIAIEAKRLETRSFNTNYRGPLAIHSSAKWSPEHKDLCAYPPFVDVLPPIDQIVLGAIIAVAELTQVYRTDKILPEIRGTNEEKFGDYSAGRFAWRLSNVRQLAQPIPCKGSLGLWTPLREISDQIISQLKLAA